MRQLRSSTGLDEEDKPPRSAAPTGPATTAGRARGNFRTTISGPAASAPVYLMGLTVTQQKPKPALSTSAGGAAARFVAHAPNTFRRTTIMGAQKGGKPLPPPPPE